MNGLWSLVGSLEQDAAVAHERTRSRDYAGALELYDAVIGQARAWSEHASASDRTSLDPDIDRAFPFYRLAIVGRHCADLAHVQERAPLAPGGERVRYVHIGKLVARLDDGSFAQGLDLARSIGVPEAYLPERPADR